MEESENPAADRMNADKNEDDIKKEKDQKCSIDLILAKVKGFYFFELGSVGVLLPFMTLYMKQIGMTQSQAGLIYGLMPFIGFLVRPIFGGLADKFHMHKHLLVVCCVLTALFFNLMLLIPYKQNVHSNVFTSIMCSQGDSYLRDCYHVNKSLNECPMTFHSYIDKVQGEKKVIDEITVEVQGRTNQSSDVPYSVSTTSSPSHNQIKHSCNFDCKFKPELTVNGTICFTNSSGMYDEKDCLNKTKFSSLLKTGIKFRIEDLSYLLNKEVISDRTQVDDQICRDYDLKDVVYNNADYWQMLCSDDANLNCSLKCSHVDTCSLFEAEDLTQASFWMFFALFLLGNISFAPIMSLGDAIAYDTLGEDRRFKWGNQRIWGTIGFAMFAVVSTLSMDLSKSKSDSFIAAFFMFTFLNIMTGVVSCIMHISKNIHSSKDNKNALKKLCNGRIITFFLIIFYFGGLTGAIEAFLYWFLEEELGNKLKIIPGLCLFTACVSELGCLLLAGRLIKKFGQVGCLYLVCIAYFIRFMAYSFLENAWAAIPFEITHGFTYGVCWATATSYASIIAPEGMSATFQGIISGLHFGFGKGTGSLITGQLYGLIGIRWTFRIYAVLSIVIMVIYFILNTCVFKKEPAQKDEVFKNIEMEEKVEESLPHDKLLENENEK